MQLERGKLDPKDKHRIMDPYQSYPNDSTEQPRCAGLISEQDFEKVKKKANYRCLTCGALEGKPDPRHGDGIVKLQQGRRHPEQAPTMDNIMPWCQYCIQHYRNHFVFDEKGIPRTVASIKPVAQASLRVQREVLRFLQARAPFE